LVPSPWRLVQLLLWSCWGVGSELGGLAADPLRAILLASPRGLCCSLMLIRRSMSWARARAILIQSVPGRKDFDPIGREQTLPQECASKPRAKAVRAIDRKDLDPIGARANLCNRPKGSRSNRCESNPLFIPGMRKQTFYPRNGNSWLFRSLGSLPRIHPT